MGLLTFAKDLGNKIFNKPDEAPEKISTHIEEDNPGVNNLEVLFDNGVVSLTGEAETQEALEKTILMAGNVKGVGEVRYDGVKTPPAKEKVEYYEIVSGDTLSGVAKKFYGDASAYMRIFEANREVIKDPDKIFIGQKIRIPLDS